jgi:hypothetical protein
MEDKMLLKFTLNSGKVLEISYEDARQIFNELSTIFYNAKQPTWIVAPNPGFTNPGVIPPSYNPLKVWCKDATGYADKPSHDKAGY